MSRLLKFPLMSREQLANTPSRAEGVPEYMELRRRKVAAVHMMDVCGKFKMSVVTWAIAVTFFNRFYMRRSMKKNNTFIIACASLFLAGKAGDDPRSHTKLANELIKLWYGKDNPQLKVLADAHRAVQQGGPAAKKNLPPGVDGNFYNNMWAAVLEAERALLHTVGFDFNVEVIHFPLARLLNRPRMKAVHLNNNTYFQQQIVSVANDIYKKDPTMALQYPVEKIAVAALYFILKAAKASKTAQIPQLLPTADGTPWYLEEGLSTAECIELTDRITMMYDRSKHKAAEGATATPSAAITSGGGAASTVVLGACKSAAYSGGPTLGGFAGGTSELGSAADAPGEHTSVPRPLSSDVGSVMPSKRTPESPASATPAAGDAVNGGLHKRARMAEAAGAVVTEATSTAMPPPASKQPNHSAAQLAHTSTPIACSITHTPAEVNGPAAASLADEEKEEGELEEGELC